MIIEGGLVALSSLFLGIFVLSCAGFRTAIARGFQRQKDWDSFWGLEFHSVPNSSIHVYL